MNFPSVSRIEIPRKSLTKVSCGNIVTNGIIITTRRRGTMTFGEFVRESRIKKSMTLRDFCQILGWDVSNWSKIERGLLQPPKSRKLLRKIAETLGFTEKSDEWHALFDLAAVSFIPVALMDDESLIQKLPIFFRTLRGEKPSREDLEELIRKIREG
jgi:transcriptional regulator with XRE-family HTH domain